MIRVHHSTNMRDTSFYGHEDIVTTEKILEMFDNGGYEFVADIVSGSSLDTAYHLTNNIHDSWVKNDGVNPFPNDNKGYRSTSVGDIMEMDDKLFIVASFGFDQIR